MGDRTPKHLNIFFQNSVENSQCVGLLVSISSVLGEKHYDKLDLSVPPYSLAVELTQTANPTYLA